MQLNDKILKCEALLEQKDNLEDPKHGKQLIQLKKIENKIDNLIQEMEKELIELEKELKSQKKKKNQFHDLKTKEKILELLKNKVKILKSKFKGEEVDEEEVQDNTTALEKFEEILKKSKNLGESTQRDLYLEEKDKIDEWNERKKNQDEMLDELGKGIQQLKYEGEMAGKGIDDIGKKVKHTGKKIDGTQTKIKTQNERLNELLNKIRSSDKICCDIILILILLGLICVLYSIIKHKYKK